MQLSLRSAPLPSLQRITGHGAGTAKQPLLCQRGRGTDLRCASTSSKTQEAYDAALAELQAAWDKVDAQYVENWKYNIHELFKDSDFRGLDSYDTLIAALPKVTDPAAQQVILTLLPQLKSEAAGLVFPYDVPGDNTTELDRKQTAQLGDSLAGISALCRHLKAAQDKITPKLQDINATCSKLEERVDLVEEEVKAIATAAKVKAAEVQATHGEVQALRWRWASVAADVRKVAAEVDGATDMKEMLASLAKDII